MALNHALPADRELVDRVFLAMIAAPEFPTVRAVPGDREGARRDVRRIASMLFCSSDVHPSIVTFAKHRTAQHWGLSEEDVDELITARLLVKAARLMADQHILSAQAA